MVDNKTLSLYKDMNYEMAADSDYNTSSSSDEEVFDNEDKEVVKVTNEDEDNQDFIDHNKEFNEFMEVVEAIKKEETILFQNNSTYPDDLEKTRFIKIKAELLQAYEMRELRLSHEGDYKPPVISKQEAKIRHIKNPQYS